MGWNETVTTWMTVISILMLSAAIMSHRWIFIWGFRQNYYSGLWKVCNKLNCKAISYISVQAKSAKVLLILALFCGFISSSFMIFTYRYFSRYAGYRYLVSAMGSFLTASLLFLGLTIYTIRLALHTSKAFKITYLFAFYLAWISCFLFILSGFLGLMAHSQSPVQRISFSDSESMSLSSLSKSESSSFAEVDGKPQSSMTASERSEKFGSMHV